MLLHRLSAFLCPMIVSVEPAGLGRGTGLLQLSPIYTVKEI